MKKLFMFLILGILLISSISASIDYIEDNETYVIDTWIPDWIGGDGESTAKLISNTATCLVNCEAIIEFNNEKEVNLMQDINFYSRNGKDSSEYIEDLTLQIGSYVTVDYNKPISHEVCEEYAQEYEGELIESCHLEYEYEERCEEYLDEENVSQTYCYNYKLTEPSTKEVIEWKPYNGEAVAGQNFLKISGSKKVNKDMDWIIKFRGEDLVEWAWWNSNWDWKREVSSLNGTMSALYSIDYYEDMNVDFSDVRFLDYATESIELNYTIINYTSGVSAKFRVDNLNETNLQMYYGNAIATTTENASNMYFNPVAGYFFDNNDSNDFTGNGNDGTINGASFTENGYLGGAYEFDGTDDYIDVESIGVTRTAGQTFTISTWFKPNDLDGVAANGVQTIVGTRSGSGGGDLLKLQMTNGVFGFQYDPVGDGSAIDADFTANINQYYFLTGVYNGTNMLLYIDGIINNISISIPSAYIDSDDYMIGKRTDNIGALGEFSNGSIDEVMIYDYALDQDAISRLYEQSAPDFIVGSRMSASDISVGLVSPANNTDIEKGIQVLTALVNATTIIENVSLIIDGTIVETNTSGLNGTYQFEYNFSTAKTYNWTVRAYSDEGKLFETDTWTINIYSIIVTLNSPEDNFISNNSITEFNCSSSMEGIYNVSSISLWTNVTTEGTYTESYFDTSASGNADQRGITNNNTFFWIVDRTDTEVYEYYMNGVSTGNSFDTATGSSNINPTGITNNNTFFWIIDNSAEEVHKRYMNGTYTGDSFDISASGNTNGVGIVNNNTFFWITDLTDAEVYKYHMNGTYTGDSFDTATSGNANPSGITHDDLHFFIVDVVGAEVYKYHMNGTYTGDSFNTVDSGNIYPLGITNNESFLWVGSAAQAEVYKYYLNPYNENFGENSTEETAIFNISTANYLWNCQSCNSNGNCKFSDSNRTLIKGDIAPEITITSPLITDYLYDNKTLDLNYSITTSGELDRCFYLYNNNTSPVIQATSGLDSFYGWIYTESENYTLIVNHTFYSGFNPVIRVNKVSEIANLSDYQEITFSEAIPSEVTSTELLLNDSGWHYIEYSYENDGFGTGYFNSISGFSKENELNCTGLNKQFIYRIESDNIGIFANDTLGNSNIEEAVIDYKILEISQTYNEETTEGSLETFLANIRVGSTVSISDAVLFIYNGEESTGQSFLNGTNTVLRNANFLIPNVENDTNITFYWGITLSDSTKINLSEQNQTVYNLDVDNCSIGTVELFNFSVVDEETQIQLSNPTIETAVNIYDQTGATLILNYSNIFTGTNPLNICINRNLSSSSLYSVNVIVRYEDEDHSNEYYNIVNSSLTNGTESQAITLYDLSLNDSTEFQLTFTGSDFLPVEDALVYVDRQYISENTFKTVELPKTDYNGQSVLHLVRNDVIYNVRIIKDGVVLGNFENLVAFCDDFTIGDCNIELNAFDSVEAVFNYDEDLGIIFEEPEYSANESTITFNFITSDGSAKTVLLEVSRNDIFGNRSICTSTLISSGGTLTCAIDPNIDESVLKTEVYVDQILTVKGSVSLDSSNFGVGGYLIMFVMALSLIIMFAGSGKTAILIAILLSLAGAIGLGLVSGDLIGIGASGLWLIVIIIAGIYKLNKERVN